MNETKRVDSSGAPVTWFSMAIGVALMIAGLGFGVVVPVTTAFDLVESHQLQADGVETTGTIVSTSCRRGDKSTRISYDVDGQRHAFTSPGGCQTPGRTVEVVYDPEDPQRAIAPTVAPGAGQRTLFAGFVAFFGFIAAAAGFTRLPRRSSPTA